MARQESDREDLLREATALVDRIEVRCPWHDESVVIGFRENGALSLFVGQDEAYHFDREGALRRGFWHGRLLKAERGRLVELTRVRQQDQTLLQRRVLSPLEQQTYLTRLAERFDQLRATFAQGAEQVVGQVTRDAADLRPRFLAWQRQLPASIAVADIPRLR